MRANLKENAIGSEIFSEFDIELLQIFHKESISAAISVFGISLSMSKLRYFSFVPGYSFKIPLALTC